MNKLSEILNGISTVAIAGHVNPDGDCIGSCIGLYLYLKENFPMIQADVYLEKPRKVFDFLQGISQVKEQWDSRKQYDAVIIMDVSSRDRIGVIGALFDQTSNTVCIDHHITNAGLGKENHILPNASSTCEVLYGLLQDESITEACAEALYMGIIHDTGVFQYSNTSPETMRIAAKLMEKKIPFAEIADNTFYKKSYVQNQIMGRTLMESIMILNGKCIVGIVRRKELDFYGLETKDLEGIVSQLRNTEGVEVALFLYEMTFQEFKVSMRANKEVDVSVIASIFGGGGHKKAAGCTMHGNPYDVINNITLYIEKQLTGVE